MSDKIVTECGEEQDKNKKPSGFIIKEVTDGKEIKIAQRFLLIKKGVKKQDDDKKSPEIGPGKDHRGFLVEEKDIF